jgi:hypothetical protein
LQRSINQYEGTRDGRKTLIPAVRGHYGSSEVVSMFAFGISHLLTANQTIGQSPATKAKSSFQNLPHHQRTADAVIRPVCFRCTSAITAALSSRSCISGATTAEHKTVRLNRSVNLRLDTLNRLPERLKSVFDEAEALEGVREVWDEEGQQNCCFRYPAQHAGPASLFALRVAPITLVESCSAASF